MMRGKETDKVEATCNVTVAQEGNCRDLNTCNIKAAYKVQATYSVKTAEARFRKQQKLVLVRYERHTVNDQQKQDCGRSESYAM